MRLIDADKENERLLDFIAQNDAGIQYALEHKDMTMLEDIFFDYFEGQTIAYNIDKVIDRINTMFKHHTATKIVQRLVVETIEAGVSS